MTDAERSDREDLALMRKYLAAHARRGRRPAAESLARFADLCARVAGARSQAA